MATPEAPSSTDLAVDRTRLAYDRTLMAWIRTSASLISFGFTIYKFFQFLGEKGESFEGRLFNPRRFALTLITIGIISLILATIQTRHYLKTLRHHFVAVPYSLTTLVAALVGLLGFVSFLAVILRQ